MAYSSNIKDTQMSHTVALADTFPPHYENGH